MLLFSNVTSSEIPIEKKWNSKLRVLNDKTEFKIKKVACKVSILQIYKFEIQAIVIVFV